MDGLGNLFSLLYMYELIEKMGDVFVSDVAFKAVGNRSFLLKEIASQVILEFISTNSLLTYPSQQAHTPFPTPSPSPPP